ncbi:hypothetical protein CYY_001468 [Polysphondylium violaceum]|uniref:S1 motif domain-containing protein n=1 Tax=Polysphondylium violaceum TaxID=133409 RepID=A0A8J4Q374_9MYCE|nr:hypothetical protein CYY_001468 [Polysphondylium violaceum]
MTDFVRGKTQHKKISAEKDDEEIISSKRIVPKRPNQSDKDKKVSKKLKSETTETTESDKDKNLFTSAYSQLKNIKKHKNASNLENLTPTQAKEYIADPNNSLTRKEEEDAKRMLPFLRKNIPTSATRIMKKDLHPGMVVLASFESISEIDITISLPFGLKGFVKFNEISDSFTEWMTKVLENDQGNDSNFKKMKTISDQLRKMFSKGQLIKCGIVGLTDHHTEGLHCTFRPEVVNSGCSIDTFAEGMTIYGTVQSIQDKGYIVSFGSNDYNGFLEFKNTCYYHPGSTNEDPVALYVGQPVECAILEVDKSTKTLKLSASHQLVSRATIKNSEVVTMDSIKAGMLVETKVLAVLNNGLHLAFLDFFAGDVFILHVQNNLESYKPDQNLKARILFVNQVQKRIGLSCLNHILGYKPYPFGTLKTGQIIEENQLTIEKVDPLEMIVSKPSTAVGQSANALVKGYIHLNESETNVDNLTNAFKRASKLNKKCRVKHLDYLDGMATYTCKSKEIEKTFYSYQDIQCGMILNGKIKQVRDDSLEVEIAPSIYAVVPRNSMAEMIVREPAKMFKVGQVVKVRVITVDAEKKRLVVTLKKSLIHSEYPIISNQEYTVPPGTLSHGVITKTTPNLVFVSFYNNCFGVVQRQELSKSIVESTQRQFPIGRTVLTRVLQKGKNGLNLSLIIEESDFETHRQIMDRLIKEQQDKMMKEQQNNQQDNQESEQEESEQEESEQENESEQESSESESEESESEQESESESEPEPTPAPVKKQPTKPTTAPAKKQAPSKVAKTK